MVEKRARTFCKNKQFNFFEYLYGQNKAKILMGPNFSHLVA